LAAWYLAFANDSFDCSLVADCFFWVFATDRLRGNGLERSVLSDRASCGDGT
jgi:hypothetical protein